MKKLILLFTPILCSCASLNAIGIRQACDMQWFGDAHNLEELNCYDQAKAKKDPNYIPDKAIRAKLENELRAEFEGEVYKCQIILSHIEEPVGGVVRVPPGIPDTAYQEKIKRHCSTLSRPNWALVEERVGKEFLGEAGGSNAFCGQYGCFGASSSSAQYRSFKDVTFRCTP